MVLTEEERKQRKKEYQKEYRENNKEQRKEWRENNKEHIKQKAKEYYQNNKEHIKQQNKEYNKQYSQTENGRKSNTISNWKNYGVIHDNFDELYNHYISTNKCDVCSYEFDEKNWKCLDHDHDTGKFRQILCNGCNIYDNWKSKI